MNEHASLNSNLVSSPTEKDQIVNGVNVGQIVEIFESLGYECKVNSELHGTSGVKHPFDIIARRDAEIIVTEVVSFRASILDTPASDSEVIERIQIAGIQVRAKAWDCGAYQCLIVYLSSYFSDLDSQHTSKYDPFELFLRQNDIKVVRSATMQGAAEKLRALLGEVELNCTVTTT